MKGGESDKEEGEKEINKFLFLFFLTFEEFLDYVNASSNKKGKP